ncbi:hypothetical protein T265_00907 [Opisthorchis viverrini]|uniref:Uncharacterized protein n=1 Tax=Opisthorchis viverrini TaxID=6198 RepID=A0A075AJE0_OPIVI|nr:hypothetical protein T265_00907 [Opisthorchis viverrini]KER33219.1 hypothetical protein T265_00907 [Opisthorchis viverrini]
MKAIRELRPPCVQIWLCSVPTVVARRVISKVWRTNRVSNDRIKFIFCSCSHHSRLHDRATVLAYLFWRVHTQEKHWTRVSLLLELVSSTYPMTVPGFEPRRSDMRGECETTTPPTHVGRDACEFSRLNRPTRSHLSDVIRVPNSSNDDPATVLVMTIDLHASQDFPVSVTYPVSPHQGEALNSNSALIRAHQQCISNGRAGIRTPDI